MFNPTWAIIAAPFSVNNSVKTEGQSLCVAFSKGGWSLGGAFYPEGQSLRDAFYPAGQSLRLTSPFYIIDDVCN